MSWRGFPPFGVPVRTLDQDIAACTRRLVVFRNEMDGEWWVAPIVGSVAGLAAPVAICPSEAAARAALRLLSGGCE